ncbi:hypothetical protein PYCCODRAFT_1467311 [Trametes coccinea BRFM310]|uniref:Uncharacterized protein n=1 Tax=Trametes coccinea (strain BRFM310) TaxID=1353009 RepID=A0A1Y2IQN2_TRAC3|nr:hypothetical protein PYCCODRAFT_1467311 [Trametes coccinea BRFM310]
MSHSSLPQLMALVFAESRERGLRSDTRSILSQKRRLDDNLDYQFTNVKATRHGLSDRPLPLRLASPPPPLRREREDRAVRKHRLRREAHAQNVRQVTHSEENQLSKAQEVQESTSREVSAAVPPNLALEYDQRSGSPSVESDSSMHGEAVPYVANGAAATMPDRSQQRRPIPNTHSGDASAAAPAVPTHPSDRSKLPAEQAYMSAPRPPVGWTSPNSPAPPTVPLASQWMPSQSTSIGEPSAGHVYMTGSPPVNPGLAGFPAKLIETIQRLYYDEYRVLLNPEQAVHLWAGLDTSQRSHVLQAYDYAVAEANLRVAQALSTPSGSQLQHSPSTPPANDSHLVEALRPNAHAGIRADPPPPRTASTPPPLPAKSSRPSNSALQVAPVASDSLVPVARNSSQPASAGTNRPSNWALQVAPVPSSSSQVAPVPSSSSMPVTRNWSLSSDSTCDDLGLNLMEAAIGSHMDVEEDKSGSVSSNSSSDQSRSGSSSRSSRRSTIPSHQKGKQHAVHAFDSVGSLGEQSSRSSTASRHPSIGLRDEHDKAGQVNSQLALLLLQNIQAMQASVREQADALRENIASSREFQAKMTAEIEQLKANLSQNRQQTPTASPSFSLAKSTPTRVSDMKVDRRVLQAMGRVVPPTPEEEEKRVRNLLVDRIHKHVLALLGCCDTSKLAERFPPLSDDDIASYTNGDGQIVCSPDNFRVDFHNSWKGFEFNVEARVIIINTFLAKVRGGAFAAQPIPGRLLTEEVIGAVVDQYMISLRRAYRSQVKPPDKESTDKTKRRAAMTARQGTLYRSRRFVIIRMQEFTRHRILFDRLSASNMSGDETDGDKVMHAPVYRIIHAEWQSEALRAFLWAVDAEYIAHWESPPNSRRTKGNMPRKRVLRPNSQTVSGTAPMGLWRNCYNPQWLAKKKEWQVEALQIIDEDYDFSI